MHIQIKSKNKLYLSKSLYIRGLQCHKSLWLKKFHSDRLTPPDKKTQKAFTIGHQIGEMAYKLYPNGVSIPYKSTFAYKLDYTKELMNNKTHTIYEASFQYEKIFVMVDILVANDYGTISIYEVKSSSHMKDVYIDDLAVQYYVLRGLGYDIREASIVYLKHPYSEIEDKHINDTFTIKDISKEVKSKQTEIQEVLQGFNALSKYTEPDIEIGNQCMNPYKCDAYAYCHKKA